MPSLPLTSRQYRKITPISIFELQYELLYLFFAILYHDKNAIFYYISHLEKKTIGSN